MDNIFNKNALKERYCKRLEREWVGINKNR